MRDFNKTSAAASTSATTAKTGKQEYCDAEYNELMLLVLCLGLGHKWKL